MIILLLLDDSSKINIFLIIGTTSSRKTRHSKVSKKHEFKSIERLRKNSSRELQSWSGSGPEKGGLYLARLPAKNCYRPGFS